MNIVFISTYGVACGIATYTEALAKSLKKAGHTVSILAEIKDKQPQQQTIDGIPVYRIWARSLHNKTLYGLGAILRAIDSSEAKPDVVHFQHEFGIFPNSNGFIELVAALEQRNIRVVTTLHTVLAPPEGVGFFQNLGGCAIVHTDEAMAALAAHSDARGVYVIPHGLSLGETNPPRETAAPNILVPGFISKNKAPLEIVEAFAAAIAAHGPCGTLRFMGLCRDEQLQQELEQTISRYYCLDEYIKLDLAFHSEAIMAKAFYDADFVILGGEELSSYSASGQLSGCISHAVPVLAKNTPIYRSGGDCGVVLYEEGELWRYIKAFKSVELRKRLHEKHLAVRECRTWEIVAERHERIYRNV